jgi:hypothetical protein
MSFITHSLRQPQDSVVTILQNRNGLAETGAIHSFPSMTIAARS